MSETARDLLRPAWLVGGVGLGLLHVPNAIQSYSQFTLDILSTHSVLFVFMGVDDVIIYNSTIRRPL